MAIYDVNGIQLDANISTAALLNNALSSMLLIAHRGGSSYPENTMAAAEGSVETNHYKAVEADVRFTSDGVPVLLHDTTINRTARNSDGTTISPTINIASITYAQALTYDFGVYKGAEFTGEKIPTLEEFLLYMKKVDAVAELDLSGRVSTAAQYKSIVDTVVNCGMTHSTVFTVALSELPTYLALNAKLITCITARNTNAKIDEMDAYNSALMICSVPLADVTKTLADYAHGKGYLVKAWTTNSTAQVNSCIANHVDWMITDSFLPANL